MKRDGAIPQRLGTLIGVTARQWRRALDQRLQPLGLTEAMWSPLLNLARSDLPMRQGDLANALLLDRSSMVRIVANLEAAGLIARDDSETDRRVKRLAVTHRGRALASAVELIADELESELISNLPTEQINLVRTVIAQICVKLPVEIESPGK